MDNLIQFKTDGEDAFENELLGFFKRIDDLSAVSEETHEQGHSWPMRYHLSAQRVNLLRPFVEYFPQKQILEIGSDGGVLTRFLGETAARVVALESNFRRATITAERCRDLDQITVINDHLASFESADLFDVVIVAGGFDDHVANNSYSAIELLNKANSLLKDDGILILALDNKLGLKHWAGIPEEHTGIAYAGIENRYASHHPFTFGKQELQHLLQNAGFAHHEFYYPFPDYKFPAVILKEKALQVPDFNIADLLLSNLNYVQNNWYPPGFSLERAIRQVIANGLTAHLANSFLVIGQKKKQSITDDAILAWLYSARRKKAYQKENIFRLQNSGNIIVEKNKLFPNEAAAPFSNVFHRIHNEPYIQGEIYFLQFIDIISTPGWTVNQLIDWAFPYYKLLLSLSQQIGHEWYLNGNYVDLAPFNILIDKQGHLHVFDQEWQVNERIPLSFVLFRGLYHCLAKPLSFYPPEPGTPLFAYELIQKIISAFCTAPANMVHDFSEREQAWFSAISLSNNRPPQNFQLNIIAGYSDTGPVINNDITVAPLQTIRSKVYLQTATTDFSEQYAYDQVIALKTGQQAYAILVDHPLSNVQTIGLDLAEQSGIIQFHAWRIKDDQGHVLFDWDGNGMENITLIDTLLIKDTKAGNAKACMLLSNDPRIVFTLPSTLRDSKGNSFIVELALSAMEESKSEVLANNMNNLLPLLRYSTLYKNGGNAQVTGPAGIQQLITDLVQDVVQSLEVTIATTSHEKTLLEDQVAKQEKEIASLQKTAGLYSAVSEENSRLKQSIEWFKQTYEVRSLPGILKDRLVKIFKKAYTGLLSRIRKQQEEVIDISEG